MAIRRRKLPKQKREELDNDDDKLSVNRLKEGEEEGPISVNRALEKEREEQTANGGKNATNVDDEEVLEQLRESVTEHQGEQKRQTGGKGKLVPLAKEERNIELDKEPIEEKDLGLGDDDFLLSRKVSKRDLLSHIDAQEKQFLGSNLRKARDFAAIFDRGQSSPEDPKLDLDYSLRQNPELRRQLIAQQLLRNYYSEKEQEQRNANAILKELKLFENEDFAAALAGEEDGPPAYENEDIVAMLAKVLPKL